MGNNIKIERYLSAYKEFNPISVISINGADIDLDLPSMVDFFRESPMENQDAIIEYLKNGTPTCCTPSIARDVITGKVIGSKVYGQTDGVFHWNSLIPYYVKEYNLRLPDVFVRHVQSLSDQNNSR